MPFIFAKCLLTCALEYGSCTASNDELVLNVAFFTDSRCGMFSWLLESHKIMSKPDCTEVILRTDRHIYIYVIYCRFFTRFIVTNYKRFYYIPIYIYIDSKRGLFHQKKNYISKIKYNKTTTALATLHSIESTFTH